MTVSHFVSFFFLTWAAMYIIIAVYTAAQMPLSLFVKYLITLKQTQRKISAKKQGSLAE